MDHETLKHETEKFFEIKVLKYENTELTHIQENVFTAEYNLVERERSCEDCGRQVSGRHIVLRVERDSKGRMIGFESRCSPCKQKWPAKA